MRDERRLSFGVELRRHLRGPLRQEYPRKSNQRKGGLYAPALERLVVGNAQLHFEYPQEWQTTQPSCLVKPLPQSGHAPMMGSSRVFGRLSPTR